jgi:hypothetical protein
MSESVNKDLIIENLKQAISHEIQDKLRSQGLMTSRGVYERSLYDAYYVDFPSLKKLPQVAETYKHIINEWGKLDKDSMYKCSAKVQNIIDAFKECGLTSADVFLLYNSLAKSIHGYPWSGSSVKVYTSSLDNEKYACVIRKICKDMNLDVEEIVEKS